MKFTNVQYRGHNMYRWIRRQWFAQSRKKLLNTPMKKILQQNHIPVFDAVEVAKEAPVQRWKLVNTVGVGRLPPKLNDEHPLHKNQPCYFHRDHNVLVDGLKQAKIFTNSIEIENGLPKGIMKRFSEVKIENYEKAIQMALASAIVYDATQEKLPRRKNPENPAWNYPRDYGIVDFRKNYILCNRFLHLCELITDSQISKQRCKLPSAFFSVPLLRGKDIIQIQIRADLLILSNKGIGAFIKPELTLGTTLPSIEPLQYTASLEEDYFYELKNIYPIKANTPYKHAHTALIHFNETEVKNLHGTPVSEDQTTARSLMKSFAIAAAEARFRYGEDVTILPEPVVVQCVQTDAKYFQFSIFQLNTLSWPPTDTTVRNIFWHDSLAPTYEFGGFHEGRPTISSYNSDAFKMLLTFYENK